MTEDEKAEELSTLAWAENYAKKHHWILNPDKKKLEVVIRGLARYKRKFGEQYCPCRLRSGDKEKGRTNSPRRVPDERENRH